MHAPPPLRPPFVAAIAIGYGLDLAMRRVVLLKRAVAQEQRQQRPPAALVAVWPAATVPLPRGCHGASL